MTSNEAHLIANSTSTPLPMEGLAGQVYQRTYARLKADGTKETWPETVARVVEGNAELAPVPVSMDEKQDLYDRILDGRIMPGGRHLWMSGVERRAQHLFNCHVSGVDHSDPNGPLASHHGFIFEQLLVGGGVGMNYSADMIGDIRVDRPVSAMVMIDHNHPDFEKVLAAGGVARSSLSVGEALVLYPHHVEDSREGWKEAFVQLLAYASGKDVNPPIFDVSGVRAEGQPLKTFGGTASGPAALVQLLQETAAILHQCYIAGGQVTGMDMLEIDHRIASCVIAGSVRRSARMSIMHWRDPQIEQFLELKRDGVSHFTTNISVEVDDEFLRDMDKPGTDAAEFGERLCNAMAEFGEPGIYNPWIMDDDNTTFMPLEEARGGGHLRTTNPCGEQPLPTRGSCNLGHVNMMTVVDGDGSEGQRCARLLGRFLYRATFGAIADASQGALVRDRRIGAGLFNITLAGAQAGYDLRDPQEVIVFARKYAAPIYAHVRSAACMYAEDLGTAHPVKLTTIAPTGSTSLLIDGATSGIQPAFATHFIRRVRYRNGDPDQAKQIAAAEADGLVVEPCVYSPSDTTVVEYPSIHAGWEALPAHRRHLFVPESEWTLDQQLNLLAAFQKYFVDSAISYTANVQAGTTGKEVWELLRSGKLCQVRGFTMKPEGHFPQQPFEPMTEAEFTEKFGDMATETAADTDGECAGGACPVR